MKNALTIDLEDYFQVSAFDEIVGRDSWKKMQPRVEASTMRLLDLFDKYQVKSTFFVLGWVAKEFPQLVKEVSNRGHEKIAFFHGSASEDYHQRR